MLKNFLKKLYVPEIESLEKRLEIERDLANSRYKLLAAERAATDALRQKLTDEIERNRVREDALNAQLLIQANVKPPPPRFDAPEETDPKPEPLTEDERLKLEQRARDYCLAQVGAEFTADEYKKIFDQMSLNKEQWLSN